MKQTLFKNSQLKKKAWTWPTVEIRLPRTTEGQPAK